MSRKKKALSLALCFIVLFSILGLQQVGASNTAITEPNNKVAVSNDHLVKISESFKDIEVKKPDGTIEVKKALVTEYEPVDSNEYLLARGEYPLDKKVTKVVDVTYVDESQEEYSETPLTLFAIGDYYTKNPSKEYETWDPNYVVASVASRGSQGGTVTLSTTVQVSNSFNANVSIDASIVSATVGYDVTRSFSAICAQSEPAKPGKITKINAHNKYMTRYYEVWKKGLFSDSLQTHGTADRHTGFRFEVIYE